MHTPATRLASLSSMIDARGMRQAAGALELALHVHGGLRKDGVTPESDHPVSVALLALSIPGCDEDLVVACLLHDVCEDGDLTPDLLVAIFGHSVAMSVWAVTKRFMGVDRPHTQVMAEISTDQRAAIVKALDRVHNLQTMDGVFAQAKQDAYVAYALGEILPALDAAHRELPTIGYAAARRMVVRTCAAVRPVRARRIAA